VSLLSQIICQHLVPACAVAFIFSHLYLKLAVPNFFLCIFFLVYLGRPYYLQFVVSNVVPNVVLA